MASHPMCAHMHEPGAWGVSSLRCSLQVSAGPMYPADNILGLVYRRTGGSCHSTVHVQASDLMGDMDTLNEVCTANHQHALQARLSASHSRRHLPRAPPHAYDSPLESAATSSCRPARPPSSGAPRDSAKTSLRQKTGRVATRARPGAVGAVPGALQPQIHLQQYRINDQEHCLPL